MRTGKSLTLRVPETADHCSCKQKPDNLAKGYPAFGFFLRVIISFSFGVGNERCKMKNHNCLKLYRLLMALIFLTSTVPLFAAVSAAQAGKNNLILIIDASGSMWGQVEGVAKIGIAKDVLTGLINDLPQDLNVGLVAYGHRRKGDCSDVEELVSLGELDKRKLITKIKELNPKGKTPITFSVQMTAEKLRALEDETTIILVSDGKETCGGDPCALVRKIRQSGVRFVMHVIGFDVTDEERKQLECIAEAGGGMYYSAKNAGEFQMAAKNIVKDTQTLGFLEVTALRNGKPITAHIDILSPDKSARLNRAVSSKNIDKPVITRLKPGRYTVRVTDTGLPDKPSVTFTGIEIETGKTVVKTAEFEASFLEVTATKKGKPFRTHVRVYIEGEKNYLVQKDTGKDQPAVFQLLPGIYDVRVEDFSLPDKPMVSLKGVAIQSGETVEKIAEFVNEGTLSLTALKGGKPFRTHVRVYPEGEKNYLVQKDTGKDQPAVFQLLPGIYDVRVEDFSLPDKPLVSLKGVAIQSGETVEKIAEFVNEGTLSLTALKGGKPFRTHVRVYPEGEKNYLVQKDTGKDQPAVFQLLPGIYDVSVEDFSLPDKPMVSLKGVAIQSGETVEKIAEFVNEGTLSLTALKGGKPFRTHVRVYPEGEKNYLVQKDTGKDQPAVFQLLPGIYDVSVEDFSLPDKPMVSLKGVAIQSGETVEKIAEFVNEGTLSLTALKGGKPFRTHVRVYPEGEKNYLVQKDTGKDQPAVFQLLPGIYDVRVEDFSLPDKPMVSLKGVAIQSGETVEKIAEFVNEGTLSLTALKGGKPFRTHVRVYPEGEKNYLVQKDTGKDRPAVFPLLPGVYDVMVEDFSLPEKPKVSLKGIVIESGKTKTLDVAF